MEIKVFAVIDSDSQSVDSGNIYFATKMRWGSSGEESLLRCCGYGPSSKAAVLFSPASGGLARRDPYSWTDRGMRIAHRYVERFFDTLPSGTVLDVASMSAELERTD